MSLIGSTYPFSVVRLPLNQPLSSISIKWLTVIQSVLTSINSHPLRHQQNLSLKQLIKN
jgi:hypothetical protein